MPAKRRMLLIRAIGFGLLSVALLLSGGIASAKPDPAPFQPGSPSAATYGPCQMTDKITGWKCLHYKLQEARGLETDTDCSRFMIASGGLDALYWRCEAE